MTKKWIPLLLVMCLLSVLFALPVRADSAFTAIAGALGEVAKSADELGLSYSPMGDQQAFGLMGRWYIVQAKTKTGTRVISLDGIVGGGVADRTYAAAGLGVSVNCGSFSAAKITLAMDVYLAGPANACPWSFGAFGHQVGVMPAIYVRLR
jgi:hypothetical protein